MRVQLYQKVVIVAVLMFAVYSSSAQGTSTAMAAANIITPIGIVKTDDMSFGNASVSASLGGSVALTPGGSRSTSGGGVTLPAVSGTVSAAAFTVSGAPGFTFAVSLPASAVITGPGGAKMTIDKFTSIPASSGTLGSGGSASITVGATLAVTAGQAPGVYINAMGVPITVNYN